MSQIYHSNAKTNINIRQQIQTSAKSNLDLAVQFNTSTQTVSKWKNRAVVKDVTSRPLNIAYALSDLQKAIVKSLRTSTWLPLDEIWETLLVDNPTVTRSSIYRLFLKEKINQVPQEKKDKAKKFKEYQPGYLHIDVTYLPKLEGKSNYLFVAIDRCTRVMYCWVYNEKTAENTEDFMDKCLAFFPFEITHILTDNGLEFTNKLLVSKTGNKCTKPSKMDNKYLQNNIIHRLTAPFTPKTNGMVERLNGVIKTNTILKKQYVNSHEMKIDLADFLSFYIQYRRHGSLRKELNVKTPYQAIEKWYELKPEIFKISPKKFIENILALQDELANLYQ
jgi:transposase InsO family protein